MTRFKKQLALATLAVASSPLVVPAIPAPDANTPAPVTLASSLGAATPASQASNSQQRRNRRRRTRRRNRRRRGGAHSNRARRPRPAHQIQ